MEPASDLNRSGTTTTTRSFIARTLTRRDTRGQHQTDNPKGPLGLSTLYDPGPDQHAVADIIFVHGLNGGSHSTWSKGGDPALFWPREWLPKDRAFHDARIHIFGYPSAISKESVLHNRDFARSLLAAVKDSPSMPYGEKTRLIFVAHSMGGLVVKNAIILAHQDPDFHSINERACAILFLATPHQGAGLAQTLTKIMSLVPGSRPFIDDLLPQSPVLQAINEDFPRVCGKLQLMSFFETRPMNLGVQKSLIVEKACAVMNVSNERRTLLDADHRTAAMYASQNDSAYIAVRNALATVVESQRDSRQSSQRLVAQEIKALLDKFLTINDAPEDDIMTQDSARLPGSCEWLFSKESYQAWRKGVDLRLLWLRGRPGAGKSVLAGRIVNDLRQSGQDCCFFFFSAGDKGKSSVNAFLRSMAWQMAILHPDILTKIGDVSGNWKDLPVDKVDHNPVWRRVYTSILKVRLNRTQYWITDAMDECKASSETMSYLARIQEQWPVSIIVTSRDAVEAHLNNAGIDVRADVISDDDTRHDISLFLQSNLKFLPWAPSASWESPGDMADYILKKSAGCFLWAYLVCTELREVSTLLEIRRVLDSTPSDMNALYLKILDDMSNARFGRSVAKAALTWTTYAFRPLSTTEIRVPIEMDIDDKVDDDVERSITKSCGNLIFVDSHHRVQLVHSTAREFLTRNGRKSDFMMTKSEAHSRIALVCLQYLTKQESHPQRSRRTGSDLDVRSVATTTAATTVTTEPFRDYASNHVFQHLNLVRSTDDEIWSAVARFFSGDTVLKWIEFVAANGDLHTIYQAGKTINSLLRRRSQYSPPIGFAQKQFTLLEQWGDDLTHLVTKFSTRLRLAPYSIHHLIPPFCPPASAIRRQFVSPYRGLNVLGLSSVGWDDCVTTIVYPKGTKPNVVASGPGFFAVGTVTGRIMVYDDAIFQERYVLVHNEPVWKLAFAEKTALMASAGAKFVRIWDPERGVELMYFRIPSLCLSLTFTDSDTILRATTTSNRLLEWDLISNDFLGDPLDWTIDFEVEAPNLQLRTPTLIAASQYHNLMAIIYRGEDILLWNYNEDRIQDFYDKDLGSRSRNGQKGLEEFPSTVRAITCSGADGTDRLAATFSDGDLVVYDIYDGRQLAIAPQVNTMLIASSFDGRTLAGLDSRGNLTLFDFETLRSLYRIQFETAGMAKGLAFTADNLRFIELRGDQCRVWEPTVLLRQDEEEEENSDTISISTGLEEIEYPVVRGLSITSIFCAWKSDLVFCGKEDGSIHVYDITGEPQSQELQLEPSGSPVRLIHYDEGSQILAFDDMSGRVRARKLVKRQGPRQRAAVWEVGETLLNNLPAGRLIQILVSGRASRLLIMSEGHSTLWPLPKEGEGVFVAQIQGYEKPRWLMHPTEPGNLVLAQATQISVYTWSNLECIHVIPFSATSLSELAIDSVAIFQHSEYFVSILHDCSGTQPLVNQIQTWEFHQCQDSDKYVSEGTNLEQLSSKINQVIGIFGSRLVFYTEESWIASVDLKSSFPESTFVRHFFIPNDWLSVAGKTMMGMSRGGEMLFVKQSELAVIKRGLEVTESGTGFNPRRASGQRAGLPVRPSLSSSSKRPAKLHTSPF